ncbi:hypothetical protein Ddye_003452 [Dipteronia dyeriana]|uniref:Mitochondrial outer membrane protein porin 2-like n=1 Tax=Dipteronia dyeriana TaxID=168575 RepID=A0AAD9XT02_9ROSI|nr:hypothetical protein Ddye_003452 [Dipteronia dyeriana]
MSNSQSQQKKKKRKILNKGPGLFPEIGKEAKDLLNKGYIKDDVFSISTRNSIGVVQSLTTVVKHGRHSTSNIVAGYKNATVDIKIDSKSQLSATFGFRGNLSPSTRTTFTLKLPDYSSSELKFQYFHENAALASSFALNRSPIVVISATIGNPRIAFGVEAEYKTTRSFTKYDAGIHVANSKCNASVILGNKGDLLKASCMHHFDQPMKIAVAGEISRRFSTKENTLTVGGSCEVDQRTTLKVKLNNHGKLNTLLLHRFRHKSSLSVSGEFDTKGIDKTPRIGLAVALIS